MSFTLPRLNVVNWFVGENIIGSSYTNIQKSFPVTGLEDAVKQSLATVLVLHVAVKDGIC